MKRTLFTGVLLGTLALASAALAYPTLGGPTGTATLPTSDIMGSGKFAIAADYYKSGYDLYSSPDGTVSTVAEEKPSYPLRAEVGLFNMFEVGGMYNADSLSKVWGVNGKYSFPITGVSGFAVGGWYQDANDLDLKSWQGYIVHTHAFTHANAPVLVRGSIGVNYSSTKETGVFDNTAWRGYLSADITKGAIALLGEYQTRSNKLPEEKQMISLALRYAITNNISAQVGTTNLSPYTNCTGLNKNMIFAGLTFGSAPVCGKVYK